MRVAVVTAVLLAVTGCGSGEKPAQTEAKSASRIERCTQRFLDRIGGDGGPSTLRSYVERTYCRPFARNGWVYADGTLSINAHLYVLEGGACESVTLTPGGPSTTIPCDPRAALDPLECAILHYVRRDEVGAYIRKLQRSQKVSCDDGTPLDKLGTEIEVG